MEKNNNDKDNSPSDDLEELEELIEKLKELEAEKTKREKNKKKGPRFFTIEFGGSYHRSPIINFLFSLILNATLAYCVIELFDFATFKDIRIFLLYMLVYTVIEGLVKYVITVRWFQLILQSMGMILYFTYLIIFYVLDVYVFVHTFSFSAAQTFVAFGTIFIVFRYFIGTMIKRYLRTRIKR